MDETQPPNTPPDAEPAPPPPKVHQEIVGMRTSTAQPGKATRGSTGDQEVDSVGKLTFLKAYWKQVKAAHASGISKSMADPVVFLVDCEDDVGGRLARTWLGGPAVDQQIAARKRGERPGHTVVLARPVPFDEVEVMLRFDFPYLAEVAPERPGEHEICVFVVALGGAASLFMPIDKH